MKYLNYIITVLIIVNGLFAQKITVLSERVEDLPQAFQEACSHLGAKEAWVGYSINKLMGEASYIGSYYGDTENGPTLSGMIKQGKFNPRSDHPQVSGNIRISERSSGDDGPMEKKMKQVAFLLKTDEKGTLKEIKLSTMDLYVDGEGLSLIWLGNTSINSSLDFLENEFEDVTDPELQEDLVGAVGLHPASEKAFAFLKKVGSGDYPEETRESAIFWISRQQNEEAREFLLKIIDTDPVEDIREHAVFALSGIENETVVDDLIDLARNNKHLDVREKAIFWLGQRASDKIAGELGDIVYNDKEYEVRKQAVFAISQLDPGKAVPQLAKIVRTHPDMRIRKKALFWLGQTEDPRALEVIVDILKGKD